MSLINQMLIDLEQRQGTTTSSAAVHAGVSANHYGSSKWRLSRQSGRVLLALLATLTGVYIGSLPDDSGETSRIANAATIIDAAAVRSPITTNIRDSLKKQHKTTSAAASKQPPESAKKHFKRMEKSPLASRDKRNPPKVALKPVSAARPLLVANKKTAPDNAHLQMTVRPMSRSQQALQSWQQGQQALAARETKKALKAFKKAVELAPKLAKARASLAAILINQGRLSEAEEALRKGLWVTPNDPLLTRLYARLLLNQKQINEAIHLLNKSGPDIRSEPEYYSLLASALIQNNQPAKAADLYRRLLQDRPARGDWWLGLAVSLEGLAQWQAAEQAYQMAARTSAGKNKLATLIKRRLRQLKQSASKMAGN